MKIYIGTDHAGFALKEILKGYADAFGTVIDKGAFQFTDGDDYPDFILPVAEAVTADPESFGIVLGASGEGEAMCANRVPGIRAAVYNGGPMEIVRLAREHNNANILSLGARFVTEGEAAEAVKIFLNTSFSNEARHVRRLGKF
jgi:ribose 5-phosphate isomerase B